MDAKQIVQMTIAELRRNNMLRISQSSAFQKTEKILYMFPDIQNEEDPFLNKLRISLKRLEADEVEIIELKYFDKLTHEEIAEQLDIDTSTVTRRKNKAVKRLSFMLFPSDAISELLTE